VSLLLPLGRTRTILLIAKCRGVRRPPNNDESSVHSSMTAIAPAVHFVKGLIEFRLVLCSYSVAK
jgi:hypothetical protein